MHYIISTILLLSLTCQFSMAQNKTVKKQAKPAPKPAAKQEPRKDNFVVTETQEARYSGTDEELVTYFMKNIVFDSASIAANAEGEILLSFTVNPDSSVSNPTLVQKFGFGVDEQVVKLVPALKFVPARMNGLLIRSTHMISIPLRAYLK
jgi:hypothetical protein